MAKIVMLLSLSFFVQISFGQFCGTFSSSKKTKCFEKIECNESFSASKGKWTYPVNDIKPTTTSLQRFDAISISFIGYAPAAVYSVTEGEVVSVVEYDSLFLAIIKNGCHFICYSNLSQIAVKKHSYICNGEKIGNMGLDLDNRYRLDMMLSEWKKDLNISEWFAKSNCHSFQQQ